MSFKHVFLLLDAQTFKIYCLLYNLILIFREIGHMIVYEVLVKF